MSRMPSIFLSHGAPTFAVEPGRLGPLLLALGARLPRPKAVVVISPHWMTREVAISAAERPETIHDFGGFPAALYDLRYMAPGAPMLASQIVAALRDSEIPATLDARRGLDHGAWVPLMHLYPQANVPVVQVSMPVATMHDGGGARAWALGQALAPLADEGLLIVGSGSLTHNLYDVRMGDDTEEHYAREFAQWARHAVTQHDRSALLDYLRVAPHARRAHPTPDHYLPLLVAAGAADGQGNVEVLDGGIEHGVLAMDAYVFHSAH